MAKPSQKNKEIDYEQLGHMMANVYETGYMNRGRMYKMSFVKGLLAGFGGVIGATIVVALVVWLLSWFDAIPLINDIRDTIEHGR